MAAEVIRFGTDGWRGIIAKDFTFGNLRRVISGAAQVFKNRPGFDSSPILIGYDRRFFSRDFAQCVAACLEQEGFSVQISTTPMPTPALSVLITRKKAAWGLMLTASHNPALYNGFKIKDPRGCSAPPELTREIEAHIPETTAFAPIDPNAATTSFQFFKEYESYIKTNVDWKVLKRYRKRVVFDHLFGVGSGIPERILKGTSVKVFSFHQAEDPLFGGLHPEPIEENLAPLQKEVRRVRADVGFALDGDADRLGVIDNHGRYLTPHQVFPLLALYMIEHKGLRGKIVQSVSLGALGPRIAAAYGLPFEEVPVGFKHVAERMLSETIVAGGEESGGYGFLGGLPERDGILSALLFIEMLAATGESPSQRLAALEKRFGRTLFRRRDIPLERPIADRKTFQEKILAQIPNRINGSPVSEIRTFDGIKVVCEDGSWILMRPSGTEPLLRTYAESNQWTRTDRLLQNARQWVSSLLP